MQASSSSKGTLSPDTFKDEAQGRGLISNQGSSGSPRDIEKGGPGPKERYEKEAATVDARHPPRESNNIVGWNGPDDPENPENWSTLKKCTVTCFYAALTFCLTFASSVFSTATDVTSKLYGVSTEVMTLGTSLFVLVNGLSLIHSQALTVIQGFAVGPIIRGPLSELVCN